MQKFPAEVCMLILEHLDKIHIINVSKTCVFLRDVAEPFIYATTDIKCHGDAVSLARTLQDRPDVGKLIRHLTHHSRHFDIPGDLYSFSTHPVFGQSSALLSNLKTLDLRAFNVDAAFCTAVVTNWQQLHTLRLYRCSVANNVLAGALVPSALTTLVIATPDHSQVGYYHHTRGYRWNTIIPPEQLHTLTFADNDGSHMNDMLKAVFPRYPIHLPALTSLTIRGTYFMLPVQQLLVNTPNLRRLSLRRLSPTDDQLILHPHLIPHLEYFEGPARCMPVYVRDRPVHTVKIHTYDYWGNTPAEDFLRTLEESTCPVTHLVLNDRPNSKIDPTVMMSHVPQSLECLGFHRMKGTEVVSSLAAFPPLLALRRIEVDCVMFGFVPEEILAKLSRGSFPELRKAVMGLKTWLLGDDDMWREVKEEIR